MQVPAVPATVLQTLTRLTEAPKVESFAGRLAELDRPATPPPVAAFAPAPVAPVPGAAPKPRGSLIDLVV